MRPFLDSDRFGLGDFILFVLDVFNNRLFIVCALFVRLLGLSLFWLFNRYLLGGFGPQINREGGRESGMLGTVTLVSNVRKVRIYSTYTKLAIVSVSRYSKESSLRMRVISVPRPRVLPRGSS